MICASILAGESADAQAQPGRPRKRAPKVDYGALSDWSSGSKDAKGFEVQGEARDVIPGTCFDGLSDEGDVLLKAAKSVDALKIQLDEWGSLAFAPIVFSPTIVGETNIQGNRNGRLDGGEEAPFQVRDADTIVKNDKGQVEVTDKFSLESFYNEYNISNGQSLYGERTQFKAHGAVESKSDVIAGVLQQSTLDVYKSNVKRKIEADEYLVKKARAGVDEADSDLAAAKRNKEKAISSQTDAKTQAAVAAAGLEAARFRLAEAKKGEDAAAISAAEQDVEKADKNDELARAELAAADDYVKERADKVEAAQKNLVTAEDTYAKVANQQVQLPTNPFDNDGKIPEIVLPSPGSADDPKPGPVFANSPGNTDINKIGDDFIPKAFQNRNAQGEPIAPTGNYPPLARLNSAASAVTVKNILSFLGNPVAAEAFRDKRIIFGVSNLSVNPGWRTRKDYKGTVSAKVSCSIVEAKAETIREILRSTDYPVGFRRVVAASYRGVLTEAQRRFYGDLDTPRTGDWDSAKCQKFVNSIPPQGGEPALMVHAVTPMVDSQNLDLASSVARQDEVAFFIAASLAQVGSTEAAKFFTSWVKLRRKDVSTRSTIATANSLSLGGGGFGFEVGTRLRGVDDGDGKGNRPGQILERQTFPVLMIFGMEEDDARPRFSVSGTGKNLRIKVTEPQLSAGYSSTWSRSYRNFWSNFKERDRLPSDGYREVVEIGRAKQVYINTQTRPPGAGYKQQLDSALENMNREFEVLGRALHGSTFELSLPGSWLVNSYGNDDALHDPDQSVRIDAAAFDEDPLVFLKKDTTRTVMVHGEGFEQLDISKTEVTGEGISMSKGNARFLDSKTIAVDLTATTERGGVARFTLPVLYGGKNLTKDLEFSVGDVELPVFNAWALPEQKVNGSYDKAKQVWTGRIDMMLSGKNLGRLLPDASVRGVGIMEGSTVSVTPAGSEAALLTLTIQSKTGFGEGLVEFVVEDEGQMVKLVTHPFSFEFPTAEPPFLAPWGRDEWLISGKTTAGKDAEGKDIQIWSGELHLLVKGANLERLEKPELKFASKDVDATVVEGDSASKFLELKINITKSLTGVGQGHVRFQVKDSEGGVKVFSEPFQYRFVKSS
ncbi:MAG: hypothetical protein EOP88_01605 [Verrucomicrobiaceae bacterium]|nr:MAG: hypothetical protein EOP88_01605 [Verrucomicrobiaceae bacterium]